MTWELLAELTLTPDWQLSPVIASALGYVRIKHSTTGIYSKLLLAQAQTVTNQSLELWDVRTTFAKPEYDLFQFLSPPFFESRRLGFKIIRASGLLAEWTVQIEVNTMPISNPSVIVSPVSTTAGSTTVAASITSVAVLAANPNRKGASIWNASTASLYLDLDATATIADYAAKLDPGGYYELPFAFTGAISGIWSAVNGNALVREFV